MYMDKEWICNEVLQLFYKFIVRVVLYSSVLSNRSFRSLARDLTDSSRDLLPIQFYE